MGMLTENEMLTALSNNLSDKEYWTVKPTYPLDKEYGEVVVKAVRVYQKAVYGDPLERICDEYCKHLDRIKKEGGNLGKYCKDCPLNLLV